MIGAGDTGMLESLCGSGWDVEQRGELRQFRLISCIIIVVIILNVVNIFCLTLSPQGGKKGAKTSVLIQASKLSI